MRAIVETANPSRQTTSSISYSTKKTRLVTISTTNDADHQIITPEDQMPISLFRGKKSLNPGRRVGWPVRCPSGPQRATRSHQKSSTFDQKPLPGPRCLRPLFPHSSGIKTSKDPFLHTFATALVSIPSSSLL